MAYTPDSIWRNRGTFVRGRDEIEAFLTDKWNREHEYKLRKELFAFDNDKASNEFFFLHHE
jgi:nuclear transport factor 2 (NTF2) superfamily protein